MPLFSIVVVHYQGVISRETYLRGIQSILDQTFKDFELLVYHDGPLLDPEAPSPVPIRCTEKRHNDWGHSLRDQGIREAVGDYILIFNADNLLYPNALEVLAATMREPNRVYDATGQPWDNSDVLIFPIFMHDHVRYMDVVMRLRAGSGAKLIMTGNPPRHGWIDAMQLVMKRQLWLDEGGWYDRSKAGDGLMYTKFATKYGYRAVGPVLGEHF